MADVLTYVLHYEGEFNKNSLGAVSEGAARVAVMAKGIDDNGHNYALFGGGLLGFEIGAGLAARKQAGVTMEVTAVRAEDGKLVAERPILQDSKISVSRYQGDLGIIIGRINAFEVTESGDGAAEVVDIDVDYSDFSEQASMVQRGEQ